MHCRNHRPLRNGIMQTNRLIGMLAAALLLPLQLAIAQDTKIHKVGVILQGGSWYEMSDGLRDGLRELGFVEGKQFVLDIRDTQGDLKAVEVVAKNFEEQKV